MAGNPKGRDFSFSDCDTSSFSDDSDPPVKESWDDDDDEEEWDQPSAQDHIANDDDTTSDSTAKAKKTEVETRATAGKSRDPAEAKIERARRGGIAGVNGAKPVVCSDVGVTVKLNLENDSLEMFIDSSSNNDSNADNDSGSSSATSCGDCQKHCHTGEEARILRRETGEEGDGGETSDEKWFHARLGELPTMLRLTRITSVSPSIFRQIQAQLAHPTIKLFDDINDDDGDVAATSDVLVKLQRTDDGDLTHVKKTIAMTTDAGEPSQHWVWKTARRSHFAINFKVAISWLLQDKKESATRSSSTAETEARRVARRYPFSSVAAGNLCHILWMQGKKDEAKAALKPLLEVRRRRPELYQEILLEDQLEFGRFLSELDGTFLPQTLEAFQGVLEKKPGWHYNKFLLAFNLRRIGRLRYNWKLPVSDLVSPYLLSFRHLLELRRTADEEGLWLLHDAVIGEMGEVLSHCHYDEELDNTVGQTGRDEGLTADHCFKLVAESKQPWGSDLWRAGKYLRYNKLIAKSHQVLKRAIAAMDKSSEVYFVLHPHDTSKEHHHMALTLRKMALDKVKADKQNRHHKAAPTRHVGPRRGQSQQEDGVIFYGRRHACDDDPVLFQYVKRWKDPIYQTMSRENPFVQRAMEHFHKALEISDWQNGEVSYDLGLMYKAMGEYSDASDRFLDIVRLDKDPVLVGRSWEQAGLVRLEEGNVDEGKGLLSMAILSQCHVARKLREEQGFGSHHLWRSLHTVGHFMHLHQDTLRVADGESEAELWFLRLLRMLADVVPVLMFVQQCPKPDASDAEWMRAKLHKYVRDRCLEDALLFCGLLQLTEQSHVLAEAACHDMLTKAHVLAARARLEAAVGSAGSKFNTEVAKRIFRWAFEDRRPAPRDTGTWIKDGRYFQRLLATTAASVHEDGKRPPAREETNTSSSPQNLWGSDEAEPKSEYHVIIVHEPRDEEAATEARLLQHVLQTTMGLKTHVTHVDRRNRMPGDVVATMTQTAMLVFVLGKQGFSTKTTNYVEEVITCPAAHPTPLSLKQQNYLTVTLGDTVTLPDVLRDWPSFPWQLDNFRAESSGRRTRDWVRAVSELFCVLIDFKL